ncbi:MAG: AAC(3) family N-acetyltransferase [Streptosporangiaceae bacterium]|jgi:aminoglycoside 3-N-acetyltransferase
MTSAVGLTRAEIASDLISLGLTEGSTVLLNASLRSMGWVAGGAATVIDAMLDVLGPTGTLVVPTTTAENSDTSRDHLARVDGLTTAQAAAFRKQMPAFDRATTPAVGAGCIAEQVRTTPGAIRSGHPQSSFAAIGPLARALMKGHRIDCHLGERSPLGALYTRGASILMAGVGYAYCTSLHLAEYRYALSPPRSTYRCVIRYRGRPEWRSYTDVILDDSDFAFIGEMLDKSVDQNRGYVGDAECRLMHMKQVVDFATEWMRVNRR